MDSVLGKRQAEEYTSLLAQPVKLVKAEEVAGLEVGVGDRQRLLEAVRSGNIASARAACKHASKQTLSLALHQSNASNNSNLSRLLLEANANPDAVDFLGCPAVIRAAEKGHARVVRELVNFGADVSAVDSHGYTAIHKLSASGHSELAEFLVEAYTRRLNANKSLSNERIHESVSAFIDAATNLEGFTALHQASLHGRVPMIHMLVRFGANTQATSAAGVTSLHMASCSGHVDAVVALLEHGADPDARDLCGKTACHYAASYGHRSVLKALVRNGGSVDIEDGLGVKPIELLDSDEASQMKSILSVSRKPLPMRF